MDKKLDLTSFIDKVLSCSNDHPCTVNLSVDFPDAQQIDLCQEHWNVFRNKMATTGIPLPTEPVMMVMPQLVFDSVFYTEEKSA